MTYDEPVTDAGKALAAHRGPSWTAAALAIEAQAQDLILSDVEGLARALTNECGERYEQPHNHEEQAEAILAAWRQERQQ